MLFSNYISLLSCLASSTAPRSGTLPNLLLTLTLLKKSSNSGYVCAPAAGKLITLLFSPPPISLPCLLLRLDFFSTRLLLLFKILNGYLFFPSNILTHSPHPPRSSRYYHPCNLIVPYCRTSSSLNSFIPSVCSLWNSLIPTAKSSSSLFNFKRKIADNIYSLDSLLLTLAFGYECLLQKKLPCFLRRFVFGRY